MILQDICVFLYLKFPEEIPNEQSDTPKGKEGGRC